VLREPAGDGGHEAYTTIAWGGILSCEMQNVAGAETLSDVEGNMCGVAMRDADALPRSKTPSRANRRRRYLGDLMFGPAARAARVRIGEVRSRSR